MYRGVRTFLISGEYWGGPGDLINVTNCARAWLVNASKPELVATRVGGGTSGPVRDRD